MKIVIDKPSKLNIGGFIKKLRKKFFLTQDEVSKKIGVSRPTYNKIESNKADITLDQAKKLADFFNVGIIDLLAAQDTANNNIRSALVDSVSNNKIVLDDAKSIFKLSDLIHYIYFRLVSDPQFVEPYIHRLVFLMEYEYFNSYKIPSLSLTFIKKNRSPIIKRFDQAINELIVNNRLELLSSKKYKFPNQKYLPLKKVDLRNFSANELLIIDQIIATYSVLGIDGVDKLINEFEPLIKAEEEGVIRIYPQ